MNKAKVRMIFMNDEEELKQFNIGQKEAITSALNENILISAGAGSGKTKTLSYKVYRLVSHDGLKPSDLLVLTFTNKAAFEMKERIIKQFKDHGGEDDKLSLEIVSSHIQTFDSFSMYLVKKYCSLLELPDNIQVADDSILEVKKNEILDEVLHDYYVKQKKRVVNTFSKFCTANDRNIKRMIFDIDDELNKILPDKKEDFIKNYNAKYLSRNHFEKIYESYIETLKDKLRNDFKRICFYYRTKDYADDLDYLSNAINNKSLYNLDYVELNDEPSKEMLNILNDILSSSNDEFLSKINDYLTSDDKKEAFNGKKRLGKKGFAQEHRIIYKGIKDSIKDLYDRTISLFGYDKEEQYQTILSFKDDIDLIFEILEEMNTRLSEYKVRTNAFTFSDIGYKALSLLTNEKYKTAADEIKNRFKYVLVDEYQDTNDIQETFLEEISSKATLFCVGDAKQSIYRFRNANVQLFMNRKYEYEKNPKSGRVIDMNWNYRSSFQLLENINSIFETYMTLNHGGIDYSEVKKNKDGKFVKPQSLDHDPNFKRNNSNESFYGLGLLCYYTKSDKKTAAELEALTIIKDIKSKIEHHYQVWDENGKFRDCKYSDFAILMRTKTAFQDYQKWFDDAGISCNIQTEEHLTQINAILLLQSLIRFINAEMNIIKYNKKPDENMMHLFLSLARSYIYGKEAGYDDDKLNEMVVVNKYDYQKDKIFDDVNKFASSHMNSPLSVIFLDMIKDFGVLEKLPSVGDVGANTDKIESFYQIVIAQENLGEGIEDFVKLFNNISKYRIELASETDTELENAVHIMTIHASKGLEFPIVYMPVSFNKLAKINANKAAIALSLNYGLMLPNYKYEEKVASFLKLAYMNTEGSKDEDINEHVRIFYVALTRAKEALYIVGNQKKKKIKEEKKDKKDTKEKKPKQSNEDLYQMLTYITHVPVITNEGYSLLEKYKFIDDADIQVLKSATNSYKNFCDAHPKYLDLGDDLKQAVEEVYEIKKYVAYQNLVEIIDGYQIKLLKHYQDNISSIDDDLKAIIISNELKEDSSIKSKDEFLDKYFKTDRHLNFYNFYSRIDSKLDELDIDYEDQFDEEVDDTDEVDELEQFDDNLEENEVDDTDAKIDALSDDDFFKVLFEIAKDKLEFDDYVHYIEGSDKKFSEIEYDPRVIKKETYELEFDDENKVNISEEKESNPYIVIEKKEYKPLGVRVDSKDIQFEPIVVNKKRASKKFEDDEDLEKIKALDYGTLLHSYLELSDFINKDTSFIDNQNDRKLIDKVLHLEIFDDVEKYNIYHEYSYFDIENNTTGSVDLLLVGDDDIKIIDYKTKKIDDIAYNRQLNVYRKNIQRLFKIDNIKMYLLSIVDGVVKEVEKEDVE